MQRSRNVNVNGKGAKPTGSKSTGASSSITPPLSSEQQEQKRKLMQEITQFTKTLGQTSEGTGSIGSNINAIKLRSGRTIPNATHIPTPFPSKRPEKELSQSVETDDPSTGTGIGIQLQDNPFVTIRNPTVASKGSESINRSSSKPPVATRPPVTRAMKRAAESEVKENTPHSDTVDQELGCESGTDSGTTESVVPN